MIWEEAEAVVDMNLLEDAAVFSGAPMDTILSFYDEYISRFRQGPAVFWPWMHEQRQRGKLDGRHFEPPYPHEVFPALIEDDDSDGFYRFLEGAR